MRFNDQKKFYRQNALTQSDILNLPDSRGLDVTIVSGKCADIIRSIHGSMSRLAPMGDDERRSLWFEVKGKRWEWYRLSVSTYKDRHYLYITGDSYDHHVFCDKEDCNSRHCFYEEELVGIFSKIEKYVAGLVDNILSAPEQYNSYVEKYLSYYRREGLIKRSVLNSLIPDNSYDGIDIPRVINIYENQGEPTHFSEMTLRRYMHYWRIAYEAVYGRMSGDDIEVFRHSSKGYEAREYNLDSEDDFRRWKSDVSPYHGFDVVYARVHLYPKYTNGQWHFYVGTVSYWNLDDCFRAVVGLYDAGISVELGEVEHILGILKETDYVEITPYAYRYMQGDDIGSQMKLPYADEVGKHVIKKIIANTKWNKLEKVSPFA